MRIEVLPLGRATIQFEKPQLQFSLFRLFARRKWYTMPPVALHFQRVLIF